MVVSNRPAVLVGPQPNPFSEETRIEYVMTVPGHVNLSVYNASGQKVTTLRDAYAGPGCHAETWRGDAADGSRAAAGIYFVRMTAGSYVSTRRVVLSR
jgi:flagellar hook assembly protein FlgD